MDIIIAIILFPLRVIFALLTLIDFLVDVVASVTLPLGMKDYEFKIYLEHVESEDWVLWLFPITVPVLFIWLVLKLLYALLFIVFLPIHFIFLDSEKIVQILSIIIIVAVVLFFILIFEMVGLNLERDSVMYSYGFGSYFILCLPPIIAGILLFFLYQTVFKDNSYRNMLLVGILLLFGYTWFTGYIATEGIYDEKRRIHNKAVEDREKEKARKRRIEEARREAEEARREAEEIKNDWYYEYKIGKHVCVKPFRTAFLKKKRGFCGEITSRSYSSKKVTIRIENVKCGFMLSYTCPSSLLCTNYKCVSYDGYDDVHGGRKCYAEGDQITVPSVCIDYKR